MKICKKIVLALLVVTGSCDVTMSVFGFKKPPVQQPSVQSIQIPELQKSSDNRSQTNGSADWVACAIVFTPAVLTCWNLHKLRSMQHEIKELKSRKESSEEAVRSAVGQGCSLPEQSSSSFDSEDPFGQYSEDPFGPYRALISCGLLKIKERDDAAGKPEFLEQQWVSVDQAKEKFDNHAQVLTSLLHKQADVEQVLELLVAKKTFDEKMFELRTSIESIEKNMLRRPDFELVETKPSGKYLALKK